MSITAAERRRGYRDPAKCCHSRVVFVGGNPYCPDCCTYGCFNEWARLPHAPIRVAERLPRGCCEDGSRR